MCAKKATGPTSFCEWVVGTTIESAMGGPPRPSRRRVVSVEVSTDDETDTDSVRITYPRTKKPRHKTSKAAVKKVRFEEKQPRKSAMKKTTTIVTSESDGSTGDASDGISTSCELTSGSSSDSSSRSSKSRRKKAQRSDSDEEDSEPHPTCKCVSCVRGRQRAKKQRRATSSDSSSDSEADGDMKGKTQKGGKKAKGGKNEVESESEDATSESEEELQPKRKKKGGQENAGESKDKQKQGKGDQTQAQGGGKKKGQKDGDGGDASEKEDNAKSKKGKQKEADNKAGQPPKNNKKADAQKQGNFPEAFPGPHPRRPNYIEPIRAEVVQTERVMETPEDPPPNAYYDSEHNIIRVYHGPVYGGNPYQSLYPRRDSSMKPLPMGMPHPTQNPYYWGFNNPTGQGPSGYDNMPITQGPPMGAWPAMCPPSGFPPGGMNAPGPYDQPRTNGGAFALDGAAGGSSRNKLKEATNVGPGSIKHGLDNPYYTPGKSKSQFRDWAGSVKGSAKAPSQASQKNDNNSGNDTSAWAQNPERDSSWNDTNNDNPLNNSQQDRGGDNSWGNDNNNGNDGSATWDASNQPQGEWGADNQNNGTSDGQWNSNTNDTTNGTGDSNVGPTQTMPGSYENPAWGDPTAAASTNGKVDTNTLGSEAW